MTPVPALSVPAADARERDGYLVLPSLLDDDTVYEVRARLAVLVAQEVAAGHANYGGPGTVGPGVVHLKLDPADPAYRQFCQHPGSAPQGQPRSAQQPVEEVAECALAGT